MDGANIKDKTAPLLTYTKWKLGTGIGFMTETIDSLLACFNRETRRVWFLSHIENKMHQVTSTVLCLGYDTSTSDFLFRVCFINLS